MGAVLAKFRKEKTTYEILENLETNIKEIEEYSINTQARQKRLVGNFLVISIGLYIIGFLIVYFLFFPPTWMERMTYSIPLLIFPLMIFLLRRLLAWFFQRKLNQNSSQLNELRMEKKKVLEQVMDKETYKVAIELLNRFGDKSTTVKPAVTTPRMMIGSPQSSPAPKVAMTAVSNQQQAQLAPNEVRMRRTSPVTPRVPSPAVNAFNNPNTIFMQGTHMQRIRTPFPIINQHGKGLAEKMVDYLIGDGPQNRFAMICKECYGHNGMVLQEEYEYATFRCAFCNALNPSRKSRPIAPKLPVMTPSRIVPVQQELAAGKRHRNSDTSDSEKFSDTDSEQAQNSDKQANEEENSSADTETIGPIDVESNEDPITQEVSTNVDKKDE